MVGDASFYGPAKLPDRPTGAPPGSEEKIRIMMERANRGEQLFHPDDGTLAAHALSASVRQSWTLEITDGPTAEFEVSHQLEIGFEDDPDFDTDEPSLAPATIPMAPSSLN
jgi:hypothetical protein